MKFVFEPLGELDLPAIAEWLERPHVRRWFGDPQEWLDEIAPNLQADWIHHFRADLGCGADFADYADLDGTPAGFVQCYETALAPEGPWSGLPSGTLGLDFLLARPDLLGRGLGSRLVHEFVAHCTMRFGPRPWVADPDPENIPSIRALESCGFVADPATGMHRLDGRAPASPNPSLPSSSPSPKTREIRTPRA